MSEKRGFFRRAFDDLTGAPTALSYTLTDGDKSQVSPFGLSVAEAKAKAANLMAGLIESDNNKSA